MADKDRQDPRNPLSHSKKGTARFDVALAMQQQMRDYREMLEKLATVDPEARRRLQVLKDMDRMGMQPNMGDIHTQTTEPGQRYFEQHQGPRAVLPELPVTNPPPGSPAAAAAAAAAAGAPGAGEGAGLKCCQPTYTVPPLWQAPPLTAVCIDLFTLTKGVSLPGNYPGPGTPVTVVTFVVPDRVVVVIDRFGNELEDCTAWGNVLWSIQVNRRPVKCYGDFDVQLGRFVDPTKLASPIIMKHKDEFALVCRSLDGIDHKAFARVMGWAWMPVGVTQYGQYPDFFVI